VGAQQDVITTVAGGGPNAIPALNANLSNPYEVAVDAGNNVYVAAAGQHRVFKVSATGVITVVAGTGFAGYSGDNGPAAKAQLYNPYGVAVDHATPPNVYIGDFSNCLVRKVNQSTGIITTIAGLVIVPTSGAPYSSCGYSGNGGPANKAAIYGPSGISVNQTTNDVYIAEYYNGVIRKVAGGVPTGTISLVAGSGGSTTTGSNCGGASPYGDAAAATSAYLCYPNAVTIDPSVTPVNLFISEANRCTVREVVGAGSKIYRVAGSYTLGCGFTDNVVATSGQLNDPWQSHVSVTGATTTVQVADYYNARVRKFTLTYAGGVPTPGTITTFGGKGQGGFCNDAGPVLNACMGPVGLTFDAAGNWYVGDYGAERVRKVTKSTSNIDTIAGWGPNGGTNTTYSDPVGLVDSIGSVSLYYPIAVLADQTSTDVYIGGRSGEAVYVWDASTKKISGFAGSGVAGFTGDGGPADSATTDLNLPSGLAIDSAGNVYFADQSNCAIREVVKATGDITTVAGGSPGLLKGCGFSGDGGTAVNAQFNNPDSVALDVAGNMYVADFYNCAIRKIAVGTHTVSTIAGGPTLGCGYAGDGGPAIKAKLSSPSGLSLDGAGNIYFADQGNNRIREIVAGLGIIQTVAGDQFAGYTGDGLALNSALNSPAFTTADPNGNVFFGDTNNQIVRWVTPSGTMITIAGTAASGGFSGDGASALAAKLDEPEGVSRDINGNTYVADYYNYRIRKISAFAGYGLSTAAISFGDQPAGTLSDFQAIVVSAVGPTTISNITSSSSNFFEIDDCVGVALKANQNCEIDVYFNPAATGSFRGTLTIASNAFFALNPNTIALKGTATGMTLTGSLAFGAVALNGTLAKTVTLKNTGVQVSLKKIYVTETTDFSITGGTCPVNGGTLATGASCTVTVTFNPKTAGSKKSTLVITSSDPASPLLAQATGS
jgi:sugar lactone lactonase YvrE